MPDQNPATERAAPGTRNAQDVPLSLWLRHALPDRFPASTDFVLNDVIAVQLEEILVRQTKILTDARRGDPNDVRRDVANLMMAEAIGIQRQHAPRGQVSMVWALLDGDPALAPVRAEIGSVITRERRRATVIAGVAAAFTASLLTAAIFLLL